MVLEEWGRATRTTAGQVPQAGLFFFGTDGTDSLTQLPTSDTHLTIPTHLSATVELGKGRRDRNAGETETQEMPAQEGWEAQESRRAAQEYAAMELRQPVAAGICKLNFEELPLPSNGTLRCRGDTGTPPPRKPAAAFHEDGGRSRFLARNLAQILIRNSHLPH